MNYCGIVKLLKAGRERHSVSYFSREERRKVIQGWIDMYREEFWRFDLHIEPVVIDPDEKTKRGQPAQEQKSTIVRPPAIYTNIKTYTY